MIQLTLDFETFFDDIYSLKKMHTIEYVRDARFKVHLASVKINDNPTFFLTGEELHDFLQQLSGDIELVCHNTYFDGLILFHHYQWVPHHYRDTLSMARGLLPTAPELGLDYLGRLIGSSGKHEGILDKTKGIRDLPPELFLELGAYANNDVELTYQLYNIFLTDLSADEMELIHLTMQWGCAPVLQVDMPRIEAALIAAVTERNAKIEGSGTTLEVLSSQLKFREYLESLGIKVPLKPNKKAKMIPALGKDDLGFRQMIADHPQHQALFAGRLAAKSTLDVTRIKRVRDIGYCGTLPMPLKYYGAHTGRWSGADGLNPQNFRRGSELRRSLIAPPGWVILVADSKQIEVRLNMWFCNQLDWVQVFRNGIDVYTALAADHFNVSLEEVTESQRFFGKTLELGLGYQMGWSKFRVTAALRNIFLTEVEALQTVNHYRMTHTNVQAKWNELKFNIFGMYQKGYSHQDGPVILEHESIVLPNGMKLDYSGLTPTEDGNWHYGLGNKHTKIYGGKMLENIIQALGRIVLGTHLIEIERSGIRTISSTHDEPIMVVPEREADEAVREVTKIMTTPPSWALDLPMAVDIGYSREYSK